MRTIVYKGYQASVEFDDNTLFVKVLHIDDLLIAECDKASEAESVAQVLIDEYLQDCKEIGRNPDRPYKGSLNIRLGHDLHRGAAMAAAEENKTLNGWIVAAIEEKLECSRLADRLDGVVRKSREQLAAHMSKQFLLSTTMENLVWGSSSKSDSQTFHYAITQRVNDVRKMDS